MRFQYDRIAGLETSIEMHCISGLYMAQVHTQQNRISTLVCIHILDS